MNLASCKVAQYIIVWSNQKLLMTQVTRNSHLPEAVQTMCDEPKFIRICRNFGHKHRRQLSTTQRWQRLPLRDKCLIAASPHSLPCLLYLSSPSASRPSPQTEDYLKRKIRCRPERSELVRMHILEGESAFGFLWEKTSSPLLIGKV